MDNLTEAISRILLGGALGTARFLHLYYTGRAIMNWRFLMAKIIASAIFAYAGGLLCERILPSWETVAAGLCGLFAAELLNTLDRLLVKRIGIELGVDVTEKDLADLSDKINGKQ